MPSLVSGESTWCMQITSGHCHIVALSPCSFAFACALEETSSTNRDRGCGPRANLHKAGQTLLPYSIAPHRTDPSTAREMKRLFQDESLSHGCAELKMGRTLLTPGSPNVEARSH